VCAYALGDYATSSPNLHPLTLLNGPLGYPNALGILAAMGAVLCVGLVSRARNSVVRALVLLTLVPILPALVLTQSRGAVGAAGVGLAVTLAISSGRRVRVAVASVFALAAAVLIAVALFVPAPGKTLANLPGNNRWHYWQVAWQDYLAHPLLGSGAGSFGNYWTHHAPISSGALDAHNLYLETLAELGPIGLTLVLAFVAIPVAAALNFGAGASGAVGAFIAYAVHAAVDWDWEMPAVTLTAICLAGVLLVPSRGHARTLILRPAARVALLAATVSLAVLTFVSLDAWSRV
jgi:O-antigen ligase